MKESSEILEMKLSFVNRPYSPESRPESVYNSRVRVKVQVWHEHKRLGPSPPNWEMAGPNAPRESFKKPILHGICMFTPCYSIEYLYGLYTK